MNLIGGATGARLQTAAVSCNIYLLVAAKVITVLLESPGGPEVLDDLNFDYGYYKTGRKNKRKHHMKIYVGSLSYDVTEQELRQEFEAFGKVESVAVIMDKYSGRPKGFAFVEMPVVSEGQAAITGLNGKSLKNRAIVVNAAKPPTGDRGGSFGDRRGGGGGGGGGRRY